MSMMQYWHKERAALASALTTQTSAADAISLARHALLQTEQNALAAMDDDVLRQQASVLINSLKGSLSFLQAHSADHIWVAQKQKDESFFLSSVWLYAAIPLALLLLWCWWKNFWMPALLAGVCAAFVLCALLRLRRQRAGGSGDEIKTTISIQPERLLSILDAQLAAMDRYLDDFAYLNTQTRGGADQADPILLSRASELMEALYEYDEAERESTEEAASRLLEQLGMKPVTYSEENSRLFTLLPSKSLTRTLSPALVAAEDQRLLRRGTAAVCPTDKA